jgi:hypothetical protein
MWFGFGLITLLTGFGLSWYARVMARWKGTPAVIQPGNFRYEFQEVENKGRLVAVRLGVAVPAGFTFRARRERLHDAFFKFVGISVEMQVRDPDFDRLIYLESDDKWLGDALAGNGEMRSAMLEIFRGADALSLKKVHVRCAGQRLWLYLKPGDAFNLFLVSRRLVPHLHALALGVQRVATAGKPADPFVLRAIALLSISTASAGLGLYGLIRSAGRTDILESGHLFAACMFPGAVVAVCFLLLVVAFLGRSSRAHLVLIEAALVGGFGFIASTYALGREANMEFDRHAVQRIELHQVRVEHKITRGRRGRQRHYYYLYAPDWRESHRGETLKVEIDRGLFSAFGDRHDAIARIKPGAFGFAWIERIIPLDPAGPE